jgi:competence protein ComEC
MKITTREIFIVFILLCIALVRFFFFLPEPPNYTHAVTKHVSVEGVVVTAPDVRLNNQRLTIRPTNEESNILAVVPKELDVVYGDMVRVQGILEIPENFDTSSGKEFNYKRYLANQDIYFIVDDAELKIISHKSGNKVKSWLYALRTAFMHSIEHSLFPPESDLANGLLLGARGGFDQTMRDEFITTGTIHIVALSGYNVTIVAQSVMKIFSSIASRAFSIGSGIIVVLLFVVMAGSGATAVRAGIMAVIVLFARMTGRNYDASRALVIALLLMIAYDLRVITDISFQLSFLATGGVLLLTPKVIRFVRFVPIRFGLRELVATTIAATIAVLPLLLYSTGIFSLVSLPANILILPFIPLTMFFGFLAGVIGLVSPILAIPFSYSAHVLLSYILSVIHFFATLPFSSTTIKQFPLLVTIILYVFLLLFIFKKKKENNTSEF